MLGFVGVRGVISLAAALAIPLTTTAGVTGELLPRRRLKLGYLVQEDGEQVRGGLVSGAAGFIGLHCLPKQPFSVGLW